MANPSFIAVSSLKNLVWRRPMCTGGSRLVDVEPPGRFGREVTRRLTDHTQRAGIAPPHAEGDRSSGVTSDREAFAFISGPAGVVGGVPLTRAMSPWAMPEASTKRPVIFPCELIPDRK